MKKFKFYALAFAAIAFAGCSDDALDGKGGNTGTVGDGTPAYLTISFSANSGNSSRSTADDANNNGDKDGTIEDSNHHNTGEEAESKIQTALVVVSPTTDGPGASGFAKVYSILGSDAQPTDDGFKIVDEQTGYYGNAQPIKITTGDYNVLVVVNPTSTLTSGTNLTSGVTDVTQVRNLYTTITSGQYAYTKIGDLENNYINAATSIGMGISKEGVVNTDASKATFLMANKAEAPVTLTEENTPENPKEVTIDVERALSKITFREKAAADGVAANAYKVEVALNAPAITVEDVTLSDGEEGQTYKLNEAEDAFGKTIYARYDEDGNFVGAYSAPKESGTYQKLTAVATDKWDEETTNKDTSYAVVDEDENGELSEAEKAAIKIHFNPDAVTEKENWYVQVQGYALVNLSNSINYVRHTVTGNVVQPFGTVSSTNFLWTPNWNAKNSVNFVDTNADGIMEFPSDVDPSKWFYNTLQQVSDDSKKLTVGADGIDWDNSTYYKSFATLGTITNQTVTNVNDEAHTPTPDPAIGKLMSYCFENSTDVEHQTHGLSTGISFVARIYSDAACTKPIDKLYLYAGHNYTSLQQIAEAYGNNIPKEIKDLLAKENPTQVDLETAGVTEYNGNICYYYTTEIKHFDNNQDDVLGPMEFAIMRNNIYSLSISTITQIGDPYVDPTPNIPNESKEAALNVKVNMLPWIVRYNDIEF